MAQKTIQISGRWYKLYPACVCLLVSILSIELFYVTFGKITDKESMTWEGASMLRVFIL